MLPVHERGPSKLLPEKKKEINTGATLTLQWLIND